ncbi:hypothetical protein Tco_1328406 [Tanacetum coccineum]
MLANRTMMTMAIMVLTIFDTKTKCDALRKVHTLPWSMLYSNNDSSRNVANAIERLQQVESLNIQDGVKTNILEYCFIGKDSDLEQAQQGQRYEKEFWALIAISTQETLNYQQQTQKFLNTRIWSSLRNEKPKGLETPRITRKRLLLCKQAVKVTWQRLQRGASADSGKVAGSHWNQDDQNDVECDNERAALANLYYRTLGESNSIRDSCLVALQNKQTEFERYKAFNDRTVDYDQLERKLNETLGLLAQKDIDIQEVKQNEAHSKSRLFQVQKGRFEFASHGLMWSNAVAAYLEENIFWKNYRLTGLTSWELIGQTFGKNVIKPKVVMEKQKDGKPNYARWRLFRIFVVYAALKSLPIYPACVHKFYRLRQASIGLNKLREPGLQDSTIPHEIADHCGCLDTRKSTSRGIQFLGDKLVSWMSKKQDCTAMSSAEAEYVALSASCAQVM